MPPRTRTPETEAVEPSDGYPDLTGVTVHQALTQVQREIGPIAKARSTDPRGGGPKFRFRGIDDVLNAVHGSFARWGVRVVPAGWTQVESNTGATKSGTVQYHVRGVHSFVVYGPNGDSLTAAAPAEALDLSDKSASKAMSMAYKYVVIQMLAIPVEAGALDESDQDSLVRERPAETASALHAALSGYAAELGVTMEEVTGKFRADMGGLDMEAFYALPVEQVRGFVLQVGGWVGKVRREKASAAEAPAAEVSQEAPTDE